MEYRLRDLQNFARTAPHRTISEAARVIGITQPALSESLKRLETDLKRVLLFRTRQGIALSPEGRTLLREANAALEALAEIGDAREPVIKIGAHSVIAAWAVPKIVAHVSVAHPAFRIEVSHGPSRDVQNQIQSGTLDLGLVVNPLPTPGLVSKSIATDEVSVWRSSRDGRGNLLFADTALVQTQSILRRWKSRPDFQLVHSSSLEFIAQMVLSGAGMGILPNRAVGERRSGVQKFERAPVYRDAIHLMHQPGFGRTPYEKSFIAALRT